MVSGVSAPHVELGSGVCGGPVLWGGDTEVDVADSFVADDGCWAPQSVGPPPVPGPPVVPLQLRVVPLLLRVCVSLCVSQSVVEQVNRTVAPDIDVGVKMKTMSAGHSVIDKDVQRRGSGPGDPLVLLSSASVVGGIVVALSSAEAIDTAQASDLIDRAGGAVQC